MLDVVSWFVMCVTTYLLDCYIFCKLTKEKFKINKFMLIIILFFCLLDGFSTTINNNIIKFIVTNFLLMITLKLIYKKNMIKTLLGTLFTYIGYVISETIFAIIFLVIFRINPVFFSEGFGIILVNLCVLIINFLIFKINFVIKLLSKIMNWYDENKVFNLIIKVTIVLLLCYTFVYIINYNKINYDHKLFILVFIIGIIMFVTGYFKEKSGNNKLTIEYTQLLDYVKTYEDEVVDKSKKQHEYKNQLVIIDDMIPKTNKKAKEYLNKVLNNVEDVTDNDWLVKLKNLPTGGIKGLVHFKIKKMIENKISIFVDVDKKLSKKDSWVNVEKNLEDISRILGVYLDNAIEAASKTKDKQIVMEFINNRDNIEFVLSNSYNDNINFEEIDKEGYSTKGKNRGIGLSLVKDIIKNNKFLSQSRELNGKFYVQKLYIKK